MPTTYKRKSQARANWSENNLIAAISDVREGKKSLRESAKYYKIPASTLCRRIKSNDLKKHSLGPSCCLGEANEAKIVFHIKKITKARLCSHKRHRQIHGI